jgi:type III restriction enzyme
VATRGTRRPPITQYEPPADWTPTQAVENPILNSPYEEPRWHWTYIIGVPARHQGRRPASYWFKTEKTGTVQEGLFAEEERDELPLVNALRSSTRCARM